MTADSHDRILVRGARANNLRDVTVEIPKRRLTVFTGVSGSGKSSLVFSTIAAESQRLLNETYSAFIQGFMTPAARPDVDLIEGLTTAIAVDQERIGGNPRSTVGTATDANALLRLLYSRLATPPLGSPIAYSFNTASVRARGAVTVERKAAKATAVSFNRQGGMCPACDGLGTVAGVDVDALLDASLSLADGALRIPGYQVGGWNHRLYAESGFLDPAKPIRDYGEQELHDLLHREPVKVRVAGLNMTYEGLIPRITAAFLDRDIESLQPHLRAFVDRIASFAPCGACGGTRLNDAARGSTIRGVSIADACAMEVAELATWVRGLDEPSVAPLVRATLAILDGIVEIGLGYLRLDRAAGTLSGGEAQRVRLVRHLGSALTDVTYIFDEPTVGLHPQDVARLNALLLRLRDKGNTVLVVEHDPAVIAIADHVVDLGPGAGAAGGTVCYEGTPAGLRESGTATGRHLADRVRLKAAVRQPTGALRIHDARLNNLAGVSVEVPLGVLCAVTGVAGSGKTSLVPGSLPRDAGVVVVDQAPIRGSRRSSAATWTGLLDPVRKAFAKANGVDASLFSPNSSGACPDCGGLGVVYADLGIVAESAARCDTCEGRRFDDRVLAYRLGGRDIGEVLSMPAEEAAACFGAGESRIPAAHAVLRRLVEVGLGYVTLGQPLASLSGGERQRLKLASGMATEAGTYLLDEPTTGLHPADVAALLATLDRIVDGGRSVIVVEHDLAVVAHADWVIDLGPGAGREGGRVVFEGTPAALATAGTPTGTALAAALP
ncbi:MAG: UvrABC system protein [Chloroflexota bacterium]